MMIGHHRFPRCRGGSNDHVNIQRVQQEQERKMHGFFGNDITHEKFLRILAWDSPIINPEVVQGIERIIQEAQVDFYNKKAFHPLREPTGFTKSRGGLYVPNQTNQGTII